MGRYIVTRAVMAATLAGFAPTDGRAAGVAHRVAVQVSSDDPVVMNVALNNINALLEHYAGQGDTAQVEIVAYGPGLTLLRDDISPVKERLHALHQSHPEIQLSACGNTLRAVAHREGKDVPLLAEATLVASGVVRLIELQEQGWSYLRP